MQQEKFILSALMGVLLLATSCGQGQESVLPAEEPTKETPAPTPGYSEPHQYGGWYCPDNFGFPPVDIQDLDKIPVVADRLPTLEETRNGTSLMYFNETKIPDARPLKMDLPRLAKVYTQHSGMDELVVVIQAVVAGNDTVVGYRFPNGGNGSAWYGQVTFLSDEEADVLGSQPIVFVESEVKASREAIWKAFTGTAYAKKLGETFGESAFFAAEWNDDARVHLTLDTDEVRADGYVSIHFGNLYLHIDYDYNGFRFSEKMLLLEDEESQSVKLQLAVGPYPDDFEEKDASWNDWLSQLKKVSEGY